MTVLRTDIEKALDELISNEEGMRFQGIAIVLAKQKWPELIACERKKDLGLDAHADALVAHDGIGKGVASSITATYEKIKGDAENAKKNFAGLGTLIFATPRKVSNELIAKWKADLLKDVQLNLIMITREDVIASLMTPSNSPICSAQLRIPVPIEPDNAQKLEHVQIASKEVAAAWGKHSKLDGFPIIELSAVELEPDGSDRDQILSLPAIQQRLSEGRRVILEAPAGRGKTTTLVQLAKAQPGAGRIALLVDLPDWIRSNSGILDFIAAAPQFTSRGITGSDLARLSGAVHVSFLLNGWNEISETREEDAVRALAELERNFPAAGIIVATRNHAILPPLPGAGRLRLRRISPAQRAEYLAQRLGSREYELRQQIEVSRILLDLTLTPMILSEVATLFELGKPVPNTKLGIMDAVISAHEQSEHHRGPLARPPLNGLAREYLIDLAREMTAAGAVRLDDQSARKVCAATSDRLAHDRVIAAIPDQSAVLAQLCAHHVLVRTDYPAPAFRFEHQQVQEFLTSRFLARELRQAVASANAKATFTRSYANRPVWEESLSMLAEDLGQRSIAPDTAAEAIKEGEVLLDAALQVDPIFAAELSWRCGPEIWRISGPSIGRRLRSWHTLKSHAHKACAIDAMLATGSPDFSDIVLPLLRSDDQQTRLHAYRLGGNFHLSSLGQDWLKTVREWPEDQRADLFSEAIHNGQMVSEAETLLDGEKSATVASRVIESLEWFGDEIILERCLTKLKDEAFSLSILHVHLEDIPASLLGRAIEVYRSKAASASSAFDRLLLLMKLDVLGAPNVLDELKKTLDEIPGDRLERDNHHILKDALDHLVKTDSSWVSAWVTSRIQSGALWADHWRSFIGQPSQEDRVRLFAEYSTRKFEHREAAGVLAVLATDADADFAKSVFETMCAVREGMGDPRSPESRTSWEVFHQLETLFHRLPKAVAVGGLLKSVEGKFDRLKFKVVCELIGRIGHEPNDYPPELGPQMTGALRDYLKTGVDPVLALDDFGGHEKSALALALSRVGNAADLSDLERLVYGDIKRVTEGREARMRREQGPRADGATMSHTNWFMTAIDILQAPNSEALYLKLLNEPTYENEAAAALVRSARRVSRANRFGGNKLDYAAVLASRNSPGESFDPELKGRYSKVIRKHVDALFEQRAKAEKPETFDGRLKAFGLQLAVLDPKGQTEIIFKIGALPGKWDGWNRLHILCSMLEGGIVPSIDDVSATLQPFFTHLEEQKWLDDSTRSLIGDCICILPFVSEPDKGVEKMREIIAKFKFDGYRLGDAIKALGMSGSDAAFDLLQELQEKDGVGHTRHETVEAFATLDTARSRKFLLDMVDPDAPESSLAKYAATNHDERIVSRIGAIAEGNPAVKQKLFDLSSKELSPIKRALLARVLARVGTVESVLASLNLIDDRTPSKVPHAVWQGIESIFVEREPADSSGNAFRLIPRDRRDIRRRLLEMTQSDEKRRESALDLLGEIERLRERYGRPRDGERHPALETGIPWPPAGG